MSEKFQPTFNSQAEIVPVLVRRSNGEIRVMEPTGNVDQYGRNWVQTESEEQIPGEEVNYDTKAIRDEHLTPDYQDKLMMELAVDRNPTPELLERGVPPAVVEELGEKALETVGVNPPRKLSSFEDRLGIVPSVEASPHESAVDVSEESEAPIGQSVDRFASLGALPESYASQHSPEADTATVELLSPTELEEVVSAAQMLTNMVSGIKQNNPNVYQATADIQTNINGEVTRFIEGKNNGKNSELAAALVSAMAVGAAIDRAYANNLPLESVKSLGKLDLADQKLFNHYSGRIDGLVYHNASDAEKLSVLKSLESEIARRDTASSVESGLILEALVMGLGTQSNGQETFAVSGAFVSKLRGVAGKH